MPELLELRKIRAGYGETVVLEDIDLQVAQHGALAVLGRNGVGKTSLLATIMGHTTFHSGEIALDGKTIQSLPVYERSRLGVGFVPQERWIFQSLNVHENLTVAERPGRWSTERVYDLFPRLYERRKAMGNQLSGGEQQMLAIGRALMGNPSLLLLDEPLEGLAPIIVEMLLRSLQKLVSGKDLAIILVEQHAKVALAVTETVVVLNRGRIVHSGSSAELLDDEARLTGLVMAN